LVSENRDRAGLIALTKLIRRLATLPHHLRDAINVLGRGPKPDMCGGRHRVEHLRLQKRVTE
jgi:hypothetical protein